MSRSPRTALPFLPLSRITPPPGRRRALRAGAAVAAAAALAAPAGTAAADAADVRIHDIQGTTRTSPYADRQVSGVPGVVTAVASSGSVRGFWFQDPEGDGDPRTSEALFVYTGDATPEVSPGDEVAVSGTVDEYSPGEGAQTVTQISGADWEVLGTGAEPPAAVRLDPGTLPDAYAPEGEDIGGLELDPEAYTLDFWESSEHMLVEVADARVVGPTDSYGALWVTTEPEQNPTPRGGTAYGSYDDPNGGRLKVEPLAQGEVPEANVGDELAGTTRGPLYYSAYGGYLVKAAEVGEHVDGGLERTRAQRPEDGRLSVATYNVENLSAGSGQEVFDRLAEGIVDNLAAPAVVGLEEVQDDSGPDDDGTVTPEATLKRLTDAISAAGGPAYQWRQIDPEDGADGGQPGGNIRNVFLFDPEQVSFTDREGGDAATPVEVVDGADGPELSVSPGRIAPADEAWRETRKPLVGEFEFEGRRVFVVTNHFSSKGGDQPLHGLTQPPRRTTEEQRHAQAELVRAFADELHAADPEADVVVMGDLNDFWFSDTLATLTGGGLHNPMEELPAEERYNYVFDGNSQSLDHILIGGPSAGTAEYEIARINSEFHDQVSDHDPQVLRFTPGGGVDGAGS